MDRFRFSLIVLLSLGLYCSSLSSSTAKICYLGRDDNQASWNWGDELFKRTVENCVPTRPIKSTVCITGGIADDGKIYEAKIASSSGDAQVDADCLQAFVTAGGRSKLDSKCRNTGELAQVSFEIKSTSKFKYKSDSALKALLNAGKENLIAIRTIPVAVLNQYPGVFTESEILGESNIHMINRDTYLANIVSSGGKWQGFFQNHSTATKDEIVRFSKTGQE